MPLPASTGGHEPHEHQLITRIWYKMMETRQVWIGGQRFREGVSRGQKSQGFMFYLADHPEDEQLFRTGQ